jgi:hypothetical protein
MSLYKKQPVWADFLHFRQIFTNRKISGEFFPEPCKDARSQVSGEAGGSADNA